jgi:hydrogenase expression/formation protein HypD
MKYIDEYRSREEARRYAAVIARLLHGRWSVMEICGGQTHNLIKFGIDELLPEGLTLIHGPGCPVCVTPIELVDRAIALARRPEVILASFGDMLRVPGSDTDLFGAKSAGADVRIVYGPLDALALARKHPDRVVVLFAVGFETTAPANAMAVWRASQLGLDNFSVLTSHVLVPPALETLLAAPDNAVQGVLAAGHVCTVMGYSEYEPIAARYGVPMVVTGFEPLDLLQGLTMLIEALEGGRSDVQNQYRRSVSRSGNRAARAQLERVFEVCDRNWRGLGPIPRSGLRLREEFERFDAERRFDVGQIEVRETPECIAGEVLRGTSKPLDCPVFGRACTPEHPLGAPMVSAEGACAAYYHYGRRRD